MVLAIIGAYYLYTTDFDGVVTENESFGKLKLYIGIIIVFLIGLISIINQIKKSVL